MTLTQTIDATHGAARATTVTTAHGTIQTPAFMPVGTRGTVRAVDMGDMDRLGAQVILGNTYHLMMRPGVEVVAALGGLHRFSGWDGVMLTDSGGYQVFSLEPKIDDDGVTFQSTYDGDMVRLTPEGAVDIQVALGADIQMVLDQCPPLPSSPEVVRVALERTSAWAERARRHFLDTAGGGPLNQFGIVQGGIDETMRVESAQRTVEIGFEGYALGGLSVGESRDEMLPAIDAAVPELPADAPRYVMGLGDPVGMIEAIARGVDLFDCVLPSRLGRHGTLMTSTGRLNIKRVEFQRSDEPLDAECDCPVCTRYSRGLLRHLMKVDEPTAPRLFTIHNLHWTLRLVERARASILDGTLDALRAEVAAVHD